MSVCLSEALSHTLPEVLPAPSLPPCQPESAVPVMSSLFSEAQAYVADDVLPPIAWVSPDFIDECLNHYDHYKDITIAINQNAVFLKIHLFDSFTGLILFLTELHDSCIGLFNSDFNTKLVLPAMVQLRAGLPSLAQTSSAALGALELAHPEASSATLSGHTVAMAGSQPSHNPVKPINSYLHYLYRTASTNPNSYDNSNHSQFSVSPWTAPDMS